MRGHAISCALLASLAGIIPVSLAQTVPPEASPERPRFFVWSPNVPCDFTTNAANDFLTQVVKPYLSPFASATCFGDYVANYIKEHTRLSAWSDRDPQTPNGCFVEPVPNRCYGDAAHDPDLSPWVGNSSGANTVCVSLQKFGDDADGLDYLAGAWRTAATRMFRETDKLPDYINGRYLDYNVWEDEGTQGYGFPVHFVNPQPNEDDPIKWYSDRAYRHPFIENATSPNAPLRLWMIDFLKAFLARKVEDPTIPTPSRWYFDTELYPTSAGYLKEIGQTNPLNKGSANCVWILQQVYDSRRIEHRAVGNPPANYPNYWSQVPVPGDPGWPGHCAAGECTLEQIYLRDAEKFDLIDENGVWRIATLVSSEEVQGQTRPVSAADTRNRNVMLWWAEVNARAMEQAMKNCAYDLIHFGGFDYVAGGQTHHFSGWPDAKVGNYNVSTNDGTLRRMGVTQDSECQTPTCWNSDWDARDHDSNLPAPSSTTTVQFMPSVSRTGGIDAAALWHINPNRPNQAGWLNLGWESERRWGSIVASAFGDIDSPVLYPLPATNDAYLPYRQRNMYARKSLDNGVLANIEELRHEASMRWYRESVESTDAGYRADLQSRPLVPWIYPVGLAIDDGPPPPLMTTGELAQTLAMLRGKRIQEAIIFNSIRYDTDDAVLSWQKTNRVIKDVYSPRIISLTTTSQSGSSSITDSAVLGLLNDTLVDSAHQPCTFAVSSAQSGPCDRWAGLTVNVEDAYPGTPPQPGLQRLVNDDEHPRDFLVHVECQAFDLAGNPKFDVNYKVSCRRTDGLFVTLYSFDGDATVSSGRNFLAETRCFWRAPNSAQDPDTARIDPSAIQVYMASQDCQPFTVKFDLVQVIPYEYGPARIQGSQCGPPITLGRNAAPTLVNGNIFGDVGLVIKWNKALQAERRDEGNHYVRMYRVTGDPDHPLVDMTCQTEQELRIQVNPPSPPETVVIWYKPGSTAQRKALLNGTYLFRTFDRGEASLETLCERAHYPQLRTPDAGPIELDPYVAPEQFFLTVTGTVGSATCGFRCPSPLRECLADTDDGSGQGTPDGGVTIDDLLYYLVMFEANMDCADVDGGQGNGCFDEGVTIDDLLYFLYRFELGC